MKIKKLAYWIVSAIVDMFFVLAYIMLMLYRYAETSHTMRVWMTISAIVAFIALRCMYFELYKATFRRR